ncbi:hypothetical protein COB87_002980 [Candidatus Wolfebacteria bacterium]|nr:hypothetical protein [Candidatus Wolfebacteria bacterium]
MIIKNLITAGVMLASFIFLPWWGTYIIGVLFLMYTPGYIPLLFTVLLDFYALPQEFPYASISFFVLILFAHFIKERMFDGVV